MDNKTPIQQALEYSKVVKLDSGFNDHYISGFNMATKQFGAFLQSLLPAEKKLLEDAWKAGDNWCQINSMISIENRKISSEPDMQEYLKQFNY